MSNQEFSIKKGTSAPSIVVQLKRDGAAVNLGTADTVTLRATSIRGTGKQITLSKTMAIDTASTGHVSYDWDGDGDTDERGDYQFDVLVDWSSTESEAFPSQGFGTLRIV